MDLIYEYRGPLCLIGDYQNCTSIALLCNLKFSLKKQENKCNKCVHLEAMYTAGVGEGLFADEVCLGDGLRLTVINVLILDGISEHAAHA